jgi:formamidopyrimidine-DNA glycosylase
MPEINEVRKYADFINKNLKNKYINKINILKGRYLKHGPFNNYDKIIKDLPLKVLDVKTKGKFMYIILEKNYYIFSTLGLSGGWCFYTSSTKKYDFPLANNYINKELSETYTKRSMNHLNVEFIIKDGTLYFYDMLSFGTINIIRDETLLNKKLSTIGPDIMDTETTFEIFEERMTKKVNLEKAIGVVLMNQKIISGVGNYLRADILWLSKISPFRLVKDLSKNDLEKIYKNTLILTWGEYNFEKAVSMKILSNKDKKNLPKYYNRDFFVYKQEKDIYGNVVHKKELFEGSQKRTIYWCDIQV